tara:strand:+ start:104 stop:1585 length:1482 start_codon:yes stop_codon:yes gene_type:complete
MNVELSHLSDDELVNYLELKRKAKAAELLDSFYEFFVFFWPVIVTDKLKAADYHVLLCEEAQDYAESIIARKPRLYDLIINVPPGTSKSTIFSIMLPAWMWAKDASMKLITSTHTQALSNTMSSKTLDLIRSNEFQSLFPHVVCSDSTAGKTELVLTGGGGRLSTSSRSKVTGNHCHLKIMDDLIDASEAASDAALDQAGEHMASLSSRNIDEDVTGNIMVMQRISDKDPTATALKKWRKPRHIKLPAKLNKTVSDEFTHIYADCGHLDPVRKGPKALAAAKILLGSTGYANQYDQDSTPQEGGILKKDWFKILQDNRLRAFGIDVDSLIWNFTADTAYTSDEKNDPSALLAYAEWDGKILIRRCSAKWLEMPDLMRWLDEFVTINGGNKYSGVYVEPKASGKTIVQLMSSSTSYNVMEGKSPHKDKNTRTRAIAPIVEAGKVILIEDSVNNWVEDFLKEVTASDPIHDDRRDCFVMAVDRAEFQSEGKVLAC